MAYNVKLKAQIKDSGLTQKTLAEMIGEADSVVSLLINERYVFPDKRMADIKSKIAKALNVPQQDVF